MARRSAHARLAGRRTRLSVAARIEHGGAICYMDMRVCPVPLPSLVSSSLGLVSVVCRLSSCVAAPVLFSLPVLLWFLRTVFVRRILYRRPLYGMCTVVDLLIVRVCT